MNVNFRKLKDFARAESNHSQLVELSPHFYEEVDEYINSLLNEDVIDVKLYHNTLNTFLDLVGLRLHKITSTALYSLLAQSSFTGDLDADLRWLLNKQPLNMLDNEYALYVRIVSYYLGFMYSFVFLLDEDVSR